MAKKLAQEKQMREKEKEELTQTIEHLESQIDESSATSPSSAAQLTGNNEPICPPIQIPTLASNISSISSQLPPMQGGVAGSSGVCPMTPVSTASSTMQNSTSSIDPKIEINELPTFGGPIQVSTSGNIQRKGPNYLLAKEAKKLKRLVNERKTYNREIHRMQVVEDQVEKRRKQQADLYTNLEKRHYDVFNSASKTAKQIKEQQFPQLMNPPTFHRNNFASNQNFHSSSSNTTTISSQQQQQAINTTNTSSSSIQQSTSNSTSSSIMPPPSQVPQTQQQQPTQTQQQQSSNLFIEKEPSSSNDKMRE
jgi:hypothetical protein